MGITDTLAPAFTIDYRWTVTLERDTRAARGESTPPSGTRTAGWVVTCRDQSGQVVFISGWKGDLGDVARRTVAALTDVHGPSVPGQVKHTVAGSAAEFRSLVGTTTELALAAA
ncbi:hypothetical protein [Curtobacterium sp. MCBD17_040]|uniref:hypothetical protein n=1 Tax=Curtobacterium sp. MCBD17_040 TaxID=2175674 RepID=UPI000DA90B92|nr:hypothetical protein [Curtobacterium sp. MCBD17_040]WIB65417.1 hypothetical protein DEI94_18595 [Curtobacterium sp. MCBD17_040]